MNSDKCCGTCRYRHHDSYEVMEYGGRTTVIDDGYTCRCEKSKYYMYFIEYDDYCKKWEGCDEKRSNL